MIQENVRLAEVHEGKAPWRKWGPYLSERQWGTVREDYSDSGDAWDYFTHDQSRSRAYRWGEDGIAGFSDDKQRLCFALALWNERDPILKERLFGLTNSEGNHGEDVKEYYFYLDSTPTHSYMKYLYKYPQLAYPYLDLVTTNRRRNRYEFEYELLDTGIFNQDRYFDVFVEYAKDSPEDVFIKISVFNRGAESATIRLLPQLWFRNTWAGAENVQRPQLTRTDAPVGIAAIVASEPTLGECILYAEGNPELLFTENETNNQRVFGTPNATPYVKDAFHSYVVNGDKSAVNPEKVGTKAAVHYKLNVGPRESKAIRLRLTKTSPENASKSSSRTQGQFGTHFDELMNARQREADEFYKSITPPSLNEDQGRIMRQALAGMLWTKQYYCFDAEKWLEEHNVDFLSSRPRSYRNRRWFHMYNDDVISMPDKWEYPWYAAWDLAFHTMALAIVDVEFAKQQLVLMLESLYLHPNGQIPAYEWNFSDVNPPVHAWATKFLYDTERLLRDEGDLEFLRYAFEKLVYNFTWWVNRKDRDDRNVFEGGFLGLDNISIFDRSAPLPTGGYLEQADGTAWMAMFAQNMCEIAIELATYDKLFVGQAIKFFEHFFWIAAAINEMGDSGLWDEEDGFYYDLLRLPDGSAQRLKVRSIVGLLPLCATTVMEKYVREQAPQLVERIFQRLWRLPEVQTSIHPVGPGYYGVNGRAVFALVNPDRLRRILSRMLDENEFLSPYGIRALSRYHADHPYIVNVHGNEFRVDYLPAESNTGMFGGNSNWRGPIWMPMQALIIRALLQFYLYYGDSFKVECPTGSGKEMNLFQVDQEIVNRLTRIYQRGENGRRPVYGGMEKFQTDPYWRDLLLFHEYFHGDNGAGIGASHQTGWTGVIARLIQLFGHLDAKTFLESGRRTGWQYKPISTETAA
jgi:hypothetical protein